MSQDSATDICLVVPPFESVHHPNLATAILKSACQARGLTTRIVYGGMMLAARAGLDVYDAVYASPMKQRVGERLFRLYAYPPEIVAQLPEPHRLSDSLQATHDAIADAIGPALDELVARVLALAPRILGITSGFQQNLAASAVALRVKAVAPDIIIVMGGPNVAGPLGHGLAKAFPWVDHFFTGEADIDFPDFCERLIRDGEQPAVRVIDSEPIRDMATVFAPDFGDFFAALRSYQAAGRLPASLPRYLMAESSRGCWWGARSHCTFCGLNNDGMAFREKPAERMVEELAALGQWQVDSVMMTDNIMPRGYLDTLLPTLAESGAPLSLFYEVKANLTAAHVDTMVRGGIVAIQPGIESLSSDVLRLMRKGVSAHQNIALLRHCNAVGMQVHWNILYGFPGEAAEEYAAMIALMPRLHHLHPPGGWARIVIDRYSPYFRDPVAMGIGPVTPQLAYRALYPLDVPTEDVAYHFAGDYTTAFLDRPDLVAGMRRAIEAWRAAWSGARVPGLRLVEVGGAAVVADTRSIARAPMTPLSAEQVELLMLLEKPRARDGLDPGSAMLVDVLVAHDFVIDHEGILMSIVVRPKSEGGSVRVAPTALRGETGIAA
ncbi:MAG: RiPP maturation radical SAM C-methyltransferase [Sphingomonas sp.]|uniref:RiPP maturation radical SAM C-methyltransferase n=1 Tax=Sphingomonas sp. TaxID=28214 RepID=UPI003567D6DC